MVIFCRRARRRSLRRASRTTCPCWRDSMWKWIEAQMKTGKKPVDRFHFEQIAPPDPDHPVGLAAYHSSEIMYVFGDLDLVSSIGFHFRPEDHQTRTAMQKY